MDQDMINPADLAYQIYQDRKHEAEIWHQEQKNIIDEATSEKKEEILKEYKETYETAKDKILRRIFTQFSQLMKDHVHTITEYATRNEEVSKLFVYLVENSDRYKSKVPKVTINSKTTPFDEDNGLIMSLLRESGETPEKMTIWSDGTLFHNGKFYSAKDNIKLVNKKGEIKPMKIILITKTQLVAETTVEKLIITPQDMLMERYNIL
ncbi:hypothetical protein TRFO_32725 [Tritrichomonas foetus]|uniref:Uncharacterized protein n=1 Tax=Tritrichomonas foetus TaxID=1144522 RepID=A0A1J4JNA2_9EUKA|nr:hypothetical protein TRFO_32725 [Tritrichomonas foetus]|eukprot:OHT00607.1 hypothetical protein TRFO_32725 [Tritrichomonas foetus]